jgi:hypothetical protein
MYPAGPHTTPNEAALATGKPPVLLPLDNPPPDEVAPAAAAFLACLPLAVGAGLAATYWPSWAYSLKEEALTVLFFVLPIGSGLLAVPIYYFNHPTHRPKLWKCSVWIWTWSLVFLAFSRLLLRSELALFAIIGFPFTFPIHFLYVLLALVGLSIGEFGLGLRRGWKRWWTSAEWCRYARHLALAVVVALLIETVSRCHP